MARTYLASLVGQALRYGIPTRRRFGAVKGAIARRGLPVTAFASSMKALPRRSEPELDAFLARLVSEWGDLDTDAPVPVIEGTLVLERAVARTVFLFVGQPTPSFVAKIPRGSSETLEMEADALRSAAKTEEPVAPRFLGRAAGAWVQQGLRGAPLLVDAIRPENAKALVWPERLETLTGRLADLGSATAAPARPSSAFLSFLERAATYEHLSEPARARVGRAASELKGLEVGVLKHSDTSPQNCLFEGPSLVGLVDWEMAEMGGAPAFDVYNAAVSYLEHGIGLVRWDEDEVVDAFVGSWRGSAFFEGARDAARRAARSAGVPEELFQDLEVAFFARRLARRMDDPSGYPTGPRSAARMIEAVCEH